MLEDMCTDIRAAVLHELGALVTRMLRVVESDLGGDHEFTRLDAVEVS